MRHLLAAVFLSCAIVAGALAPPAPAAPLVATVTAYVKADQAEALYYELGKCRRHRCPAFYDAPATLNGHLVWVRCRFNVRVSGDTAAASSGHFVRITRQQIADDEWGHRAARRGL